jgi:hypothetical protein
MFSRAGTGSLLGEGSTYLVLRGYLEAAGTFRGPSVPTGERLLGPRPACKSGAQGC